MCTQLIKGEAEPNRFVSWHYTIRSNDGHVDQHVANRNVAAHAGNWYLNMHSIGVEHEGKAGAARPVVHRGALPLLVRAGEVPRRQVRLRARPGARGGSRGVRLVQLQVGPGSVLGLGALHGAPRRADRGPTGAARASVVTVKPGFADNQRALDGCYGDAARPARPSAPTTSTCARRRATPPRWSRARPTWSPTATPAPSRGTSSTSPTARVTGCRCGGTALEGWIKSPKDDAVVVPSQGEVVEAAGGRGRHGLRPGLPGGGGVRRHAGALPGSADRCSRRTTRPR